MMIDPFEKVLTEPAKQSKYINKNKRLRFDAPTINVIRQKI